MGEFVGRFVAAVGIVLFVVFGSQPDFSQGAPSDEAARKAELAAAWQAAGIGGTAGSADIPQIYEATLKSPTGDNIFRSRARHPAEGPAASGDQLHRERLMRQS